MAEEMRLVVITDAMMDAFEGCPGDLDMVCQDYGMQARADLKARLTAALSAAPSQPEGEQCAVAPLQQPVEVREAYLRENLDVVLRAVEDMAKVGIEVAKAGPNYHTEDRDRARIEFIREVCMRWAALSSPAGDGWQTIETAPKDGTVFDARCGLWRPFECFWDGERFIHMDPEDGPIAYDPTHWRALAKADAILGGGK